jgi:hypothetical protein
MDNLFIEATPSSPEVDFRFDAHELWLKGESYPENASAFYSPILEQVRRYLAATANTPIVFNMQLAYINSSSTKVLFTMIGLFNESARGGNHVTLNWYHDVDDDTLYEFGQEIRQDNPAIGFNDIPVDAP